MDTDTRHTRRTFTEEEETALRELWNKISKSTRAPWARIQTLFNQSFPHSPRTIWSLQAKWRRMSKDVQSSANESHCAVECVLTSSKEIKNNDADVDEEEEPAVQVATSADDPMLDVLAQIPDQDEMDQTNRNELPANMVAIEKLIYRDGQPPIAVQDLSYVVNGLGINFG
ncbi:hypothetical protein H2204_011721 [Knufia peltigerae]|uniref:Uncharacterized protein n=1 Tax=Knufia peltigerae TaxID=1002370 RepID=A0AA39CSX9_9EURO|nr:hypothetical protein H2204_011721 [Knufia peltigerae]